MSGYKYHNICVYWKTRWRFHKNTGKKSREAITPTEINGGKVIIIDIVVGEKKRLRQTERQLFWDMQMMVEFNGRERTEKEWATIFLANRLHKL